MKEIAGLMEMNFREGGYMVHIFFKTHQIVHLMGVLLYVNYISVKVDLKNLNDAVMFSF